MMTVIVEVLWEFRLTASEKKTEVLVIRVKEEPGSHPRQLLTIEAAGQRYAQKTKFRYLGALLTEHGEPNPVITCNVKAARACFRKYARELFDGREHRSGSRPTYSKRRPWKHCCTVV